MDTQTVKAFKNAFLELKRRNWDYMYVFVDLHGTVVKPSYIADEIPTDSYDHAIEALRLMSEMDTIKLVMWTCSHPKEIVKYVEFFEGLGIHFTQINENTEVQNTGYGSYDKKPYYNVLLDDKTGFDPDTDWSPILNYLNSLR